MSAWDRRPAEYRALCEQIGKGAKLSPQNRRVTFTADRMLANHKTFPNTETRQQRRRASR
jgi:hypothetical protein